MTILYTRDLISDHEFVIRLQIQGQFLKPLHSKTTKKSILMINKTTPIT